MSRLLPYVARLAVMLLLVATIAPVGARAATLQRSSELEPDWLENSLNEFWEDAFDDADLEYDAPDVELYDADLDTDCGEADRRSSGAGTPPFYCPEDGTIYVADNAYDYLTDEFSETYWVLSLARLWGVHALWLLDADDLDDEDEPYVIDDESSEVAFCLAGAFGGWAVDEDELTASNVGRYIDELDDDDLFDALTTGYEDGLEGCDFDLVGQGSGGGDDDDEGGQGGTGGGNEGDVYESPNYGYTITYDAATWELTVDEVIESGPYDRACFASARSSICVTGDPDYDDDEMDDCLDDYLGGLESADGVSDLEELDERDAAGEDDERAWATYTYTSETDDGDEVEIARYYECHWINNDYTIVVTHGALADDYDDEIEVRIEFLVGIDMGDSSAADEDDAAEDDEPSSEDEERDEDDDDDRDTASGAEAVEIVDFSFSPEELTVSAGATVVWTNSDSAPHTVTADDGETFDSGRLDEGETFEFTFDDTGEFEFHCDFHPNMTGIIVVE